MISSPRVAVVGSVNLDLIARVHSLPAPGETVLAVGFSKAPGGKGANQSLAVARQLVETSLFAAVGRDGAADEALALLHGVVDLSHVRRVDGAPTGLALIGVDDRGENSITVVPGANGSLQPDDVDITGFDAVVCQFEIAADVVERIAESATGLVVVNPSPVRQLGEAVLRRADVIVVNRAELASLRNELAGFSGLVVETRGADGARVWNDGTVEVECPSAVLDGLDVVDTVGAGDSFCGALVAALVAGSPIADATRRACAAGALAVTRHGAQPSIPTAGEVDRLLARAR